MCQAVVLTRKLDAGVPRGKGLSLWPAGEQYIGEFAAGSNPCPGVEGRERGEIEEIEREREKRPHSPFALHAPIQWAI